MKVLFVTAHNPAADPYGAGLRARNVRELLAQGPGVTSVDTVLAAPHGPYAASWPGRSVAELDRLAARPEVLGVLPFRATGRPSEADGARLDTWAQGRDVVWIHTLALAVALGAAGPGARRVFRDVPLVVDVDDLTSQLLVAGGQSWAGALAKRRERRALTGVDAVVVCSADDGAYLALPQERCFVVPNLARALPSKVEPAVADGEGLLRLGFVGTLAYPPNREGVRWFARQVWPWLRPEVPGARIRVVGGGGEYLGPLPDGFDELGPLTDDELAGEVASWRAFMVPLLSGAGTRVKIAEAFAWGCPVVTTGVGVYGYDVEHLREVWRADEPRAFAQGCAALLRDEGLGRRLAGAAADHGRRHLSREAAAQVASRAVAVAVKASG